MVGTAKGGGGGGGYWEGVSAVTGGTSYTVTVGMGGSAGSSGGNSSFGSCFTVVGGAGANGAAGCGGYLYNSTTPLNWTHSPSTSGGQFSWG